MPAQDPRIQSILDQVQRLVSANSGRGADTVSSETGDDLDAIIAGLNQLTAGLAVEKRQQEASHNESVLCFEEHNRALSASEARWRSLVESAPDYIVTLDSRLRITFVNRVAPGASMADVVGTYAPDTIHEADRASVQEALETAFRTGDPSEFEARALRAKGGFCWLSVRVGPVIQEGRVTSLVVLGRNITELHDMVDALKVSEARYRLLWENLNDAAFIADVRTGIIEETNAEAERLLGRPRDQIIGSHQAMLHPPEKVEAYRELFRKHVRNSGTIYDVETLRADGSIVPVDISAATMAIGTRQVVLGLFHDISRRKRMIRELEFTQFAVESAGDAIFWINDRMQFVHANSEACRGLGYSRDELLKMRVPDVVPEVNSPGGEAEVKQLHATGSLVKRSIHRRKNGSTFPVEVSINRVRFEGRDYFCSIARDITERERAERTLLERDANLQALAENANDGIAVRQGDYHVFGNQQFARMLGYPSIEELLAVPIVELVAPSERARIADFLRRSGGADEPPRQYETALQKREGSSLPVEITVAETTWNSQPAHLIVIRDITTRKLFEQRLQEKAKALEAKSDDLEQLNGELQQLIYVIAHDLKAPLRAVSQLSEVLEWENRNVLSGETLRVLNLIRGRVQRMHALIEALLSYTGSSRESPLEDVDVESLLVDVVSSLTLPASFEVTIAPMPHILTDRIQLRQVFANLLGNAVQHHDRTNGHVYIDYRATAGGVEFSVSDDGPGIPPEHHERIFEMFQTLELRDRHEQAGVGLALARKIVEWHGGSIVVDSGSERGARFRFTWPDACAGGRSAEPGEPILP